MSRLVLDAGAFVAFERGDAAVRARLAAARKLGMEVATTSPVVGQVWRDGRRQALLSRLVPAVHVVAPNVAAARRAGELLAKTKATTSSMPWSSGWCERPTSSSRAIQRISARSWRRPASAPPS